MEETVKQAASMEDAINDVFTEVPVTKEETPTAEAIAEVIETEVDETEKDVKEDDYIIPTEEESNVEIKSTSEPVVKEVIKEVEKPITFKDELSEKAYKAIAEGDEEAERAYFNYLNSKYTDYATMSNTEVLKRKIQAEKPHWDAEDVANELEAKYGGENLTKFDLSLVDKDDYPDEYKYQEAHNREVDKLIKLQERDAKDARVYLETTKPSNVELPRIAVADAPQRTQAEIDAEIRMWHEKVETGMQEFTDLKFKVGNEEITYKLTEQEKSAQKEYMKNLSETTLFADLGWVGENGEQNIKKIAEDVHTLKNLQKVIASIGTQMKTVAKKEVMAKDIKNLDLDGRNVTAEAQKQSFADLALGL